MAVKSFVFCRKQMLRFLQHSIYHVGYFVKFGNHYFHQQKSTQVTQGRKYINEG